LKTLLPAAAFLGAGAFAFNRAKMLAGDPTASYIYFDTCPANTGCAIGGVLPSDADGLLPPPPGAPNVFAYSLPQSIFYGLSPARAG
jgi:hypothetical protein